MNNKIIPFAMFLLGLSLAAAHPAQAAGQVRPIQYKVPPQVHYPDEAKQSGLEGEVRVEVRVLADGSLAAARVVKGSGTASLDEEALRSVKAATFMPALSETGTAIESTATPSVRFRLDRTAPAASPNMPPSQVLRFAPNRREPPPEIDADLQQRRILAIGARIGREEALQLKLLGTFPPQPFPPRPVYPATAKQDKREGQVKLGIEVDLSGKVMTVQVLESSGSPDLDIAAQSAIWGMELSQEQTLMIENDISPVPKPTVHASPFKDAQPVLDDKRERAGYRFGSTIRFKMN